MKLERDALDAQLRAFARRAHPAQLENDVARDLDVVFGLGVGEIVAELGHVGDGLRLLPEHDPDDLGTKLLVVLLPQRAPVDRPGETALPQDRDEVAERQRLVELVRDEDHRLPLLLQPREHLR